MTKEQEALDNFLKEYLFLCEKLNTNMQEKMLLDSNSPYNILKQSFEKAPEPIQTGMDLGGIKPKKYLKWEDLEFMRDEKVMTVKMGDTVYKILYRYCYANEEVQLLSEDKKLLCLRLIGKYKANVQLFNDLRLERVE